MAITCSQTSQFTILLLFIFIKSAWSPLGKNAYNPKGDQALSQKLKMNKIFKKRYSYNLRSRAMQLVIFDDSNFVFVADSASATDN